MQNTRRPRSLAGHARMAAATQRNLESEFGLAQGGEEQQAQASGAPGQASSLPPHALAGSADGTFLPANDASAANAPASVVSRSHFTTTHALHYVFLFVIAPTFLHMLLSSFHTTSLYGICPAVLC